MWEKINIASSNISLDEKKHTLKMFDWSRNMEFGISDSLAEEVKNQMETWKISFWYIMNWFNRPIITSVIDNVNC